ncbi:MAG: dihydroxy-acid dehydratase, partial [Ktedonobacteraceae bacterium]|nr:dihydroxy-acid dehydratase [Ktedonobacteraceae bacterium]
QDGDIITIDAEANALTIDLSEEEITRRLEQWQPPAAKYTSGVLSKYVKLVTSASEGAITE